MHLEHVTFAGSEVAIPSISARCAASRSRGLQATLPFSSRPCRSRFVRLSRMSVILFGWLPRQDSNLDPDGQNVVSYRLDDRARMACHERVPGASRRDESNGTADGSRTRYSRRDKPVPPRLWLRRYGWLAMRESPPRSGGTNR